MTNNCRSMNYFIKTVSSVSIHIRNIQRLAIEMFKLYNRKDFHHPQWTMYSS